MSQLIINNSCQNSFETLTDILAKLSKNTHRLQSYIDNNKVIMDLKRTFVRLYFYSEIKPIKNILGHTVFGIKTATFKLNE